MILFEITTGVTGMSYERCYAWAEDEAEAVKLYEEKHGKVTVHTKIECLVNSFDPEPFITELSTEGWDR